MLSAESDCFAVSDVPAAGLEAEAAPVPAEPRRASCACADAQAIPAMPKAASVFSPFIGLPLLLSVMCTCSFFVFLQGICSVSSTRGDAIIGMASALTRMCLSGCQNQPVL